MSSVRRIMPEGPEIRVMLDDFIDKCRPIGKQMLLERDVVVTCNKVECSGKLIKITYNEGWLLLQMGLTGILLHQHVDVDKDDDVVVRAEPVYTRRVFEWLEGGVEVGRTYIVDPRRFASIRWYNGNVKSDCDIVKKIWDKQGIDWLVESIGDKEVMGRHIRDVRRRGGTMIANVLLDQSVYAGVGNYIRAEALYRCKGIHPASRVKELKDKDIRDIAKAVKWVMMYWYKVQKKWGLNTAKHGQMNVYRKKVTKRGEPVYRWNVPRGRSFWTIHKLRPL